VQPEVADRISCGQTICSAKQKQTEKSPHHNQIYFDTFKGRVFDACAKYGVCRHRISSRSGDTEYSLLNYSLTARYVPPV